MSSNWDGQNLGNHHNQAALQNAQQYFRQAQAATGTQVDTRSGLQIAEARLKDFDEKTGRATVSRAIDAVLEGVQDGPVRDYLRGALSGFVLPAAKKRREELVERLVTVAKQY
jgi:hypothetical protein